MRSSSSTRSSGSPELDAAEQELRKSFRQITDDVLKMSNDEILFELLEKKMGKKEETKPTVEKKPRTVKFSVTDGKLPRVANEPGNPFLLRMPMTTSVPAKSKRTIALGVSCSLPLVLVRQGEAKLVPPNEELRVELGGEFMTQVGEDEIVARLYVLDNGEVEATR
jgi:hypothetical protein